VSPSDGLPDPEVLLAATRPALFNAWRAWSELIEPAGPKADDDRHAELCMAVTQGRMPADKFRHKPPERLTRPVVPAAPLWTTDQVAAAASEGLRRLQCKSV